MLDKSALEFLQAHLEAFTEVDVGDSVSPVVAVPNDVSLDSLERFQAQPNRIKQSVNLASVNSFCEYINRFGNDETSIFLDVPEAHFNAKIDYHGAGAPSWCRHAASFKPKRSLEWMQWVAINRKPISQLDLAHFIEAQIADIEVPDPGTVLLAALEFQANEKLQLGSSHNLDDGSVNFTFTKDNTTKSVVFPHRISIAIPVFDNEMPVKLEVRIRYKINGDGALVFTVSLVKDPEIVVRESLLGLADIIAKQCEGKHIYEGAVPRG